MRSRLTKQKEENGNTTIGVCATTRSISFFHLPPRSNPHLIPPVHHPAAKITTRSPRCLLTRITITETNNRKKKRAEAIITELQAQLSMALSSASGRPFPPSNINLLPRRPIKQWGSPRPPAPGRGKLLVRESDDRGGGYREALPAARQKGVSKVSMFLVPARKSGAEEKEEEDDDDDQENASADVVVARPAAETTTAATIRNPEKPLDKGRDKERPENKGLGPACVGEEEQDGDDDIPELFPCGSGSEVTTGDVWGMLDSYVHRRSEVARANRHLGAIEAMRRVRRGKGVPNSLGSLQSHWLLQRFASNLNLPLSIDAVRCVVLYSSTRVFPS